MTELLAKGDRVSTYKGVLIRIKLIFFVSLDGVAYRSFV